MMYEIKGVGGMDVCKETRSVYTRENSAEPLLAVEEILFSGHVLDASLRSHA